MFTCRLVALRLGLDLHVESGWLVVMHTYLYYYFPLSLSLSHEKRVKLYNK